MDFSWLNIGGGLMETLRCMRALECVYDGRLFIVRPDSGDIPLLGEGIIIHREYTDTLYDTLFICSEIKEPYLIFESATGDTIKRDIPKGSYFEIVKKNCG